MSKDFLLGAAFGVGIMYLLDPAQGGRRRALLRDQMVEGKHELGGAADRVGKEARNRARGAVAEARRATRPAETDDATLDARVRSALGRVVSHPGAINTSAVDGRVTLRGSVLADEVDELVSTVSSVRGVAGVDNRLAVHEDPGEVPGLQGTTG